MLVTSDRFFAGGGNSVRGYAEDAISPTDFFGIIVGGNALIVLNQEVRFPMFKYVRGVGFIDAGRAFETVGQMSLKKLAVGTGIGFRVDTPVVLLRFDMGVPARRVVRAAPATLVLLDRTNVLKRSTVQFVTGSTTPPAAELRRMVSRRTTWWTSWTRGPSCPVDLFADLSIERSQDRLHFAALGRLRRESQECLEMLRGEIDALHLRVREPRVEVRVGPIGIEIRRLLERRRRRRRCPGSALSAIPC